MRNRPYPLYDVPFIPDIRTMIERLVQTAPDEIGFQYTNKKKLVTKSHKDVLNDTVILTSFLISKGYHETNIAVIGTNSYEWLIAFFAIICSGNIAVAIDAQLPSDKIGQMLSDTDCSIIFVSDKCRNKITPCENRKIFILNDIYNMNSSSVFEELSLDPDAPAAIFFTSGTTGNSKGVVLSQKNIMFNVWATRRYADIQGQVISVLPFHHTFGLVIGVLSVYCYGCPIYINLSLKRVLSDFQLIKPTAVALVPLFVETFFKSIKQEAQKSNNWKKVNNAITLCNILLKIRIDCRRKVFKQVLNSFGGKLEYIVCGGAAMDKSYLSFFRTIGIHIINGYGITECSPTVSMTRNHYWRDGSAGLILDKSIVKIENDGEIAVKSDSVMIGYYHNNMETNKVLRDSWFYTGDIGYIDKDGFLWITGRKKNIIVLSNGENISPEEVERQLIVDNAVEEVVVYSSNGHLVAEIYPESNYESNNTYFNNLIDKYNSGQPMYLQINDIKLRSTPFQKNNSGKILREGIGES